MYKIKCTNAQTMQLASSGQALVVVAPHYIVPDDPSSRGPVNP
jgi:hypothetical protein